MVGLLGLEVLNKEYESIRIRIAFHPGNFSDFVALLFGRNFETRQCEDTIAEASFAKLKQGILRFINKTDFERFSMIIRSAGLVTSDLIRRQNALNLAYILYLRGRSENVTAADLECLIRRWYDKKSKR